MVPSIRSINVHSAFRVRWSFVLVQPHATVIRAVLSLNSRLDSSLTALPPRFLAQFTLEIRQ